MRNELVGARKKRNLTQEDVAVSVGISRPYYTLIELGLRDPSLDVAIRISELFDEPVQQLLIISDVPDRNSKVTA